MKHQNSQHDPQQKSHGTGFGVQASPFNIVKLDLGFVIIIGIALWLIIDVITPSLGKQLLILSAYGFISAAWLITKTRRVLKQQDSLQR